MGYRSARTVTETPGRQRWGSFSADPASVISGGLPSRQWGANRKHFWLVTAQNHTLFLRHPHELISPQRVAEYFTAENAEGAEFCFYFSHFSVVSAFSAVQK